MAKKLIDLFRLMKPLTKKQREALEELSKVLPKEDIEELKGLLKTKQVSIITSKLATSSVMLKSGEFVTLNPDTIDQKISDYTNKLNDIILKKVRKKHSIKISKDASKLIPKFIAPNIHGFETIKKAIALQLFSKERFHILLLGDPGTGKTEMLRSAAALHPISSFGLGSGTSGAGLTITKKGKEISEGLLPMANEGICAIDELNLMEKNDRASLYNAMEKGFITYDKGGHHHKFNAKVRILATANPKGDKFEGYDVNELKKQMPFDPALLSRFHLVFLIRKPDIDQFINIAKKILKDDKKKILGSDEKFIQEYVKHAETIDVTLPAKFEKEITDFVAKIKAKEEEYLIEVSPRLVLGFIRMAKASARMRLGTEVKESDIELVKEIVNEGLKLKTK